jgi:hypothetical protein
VGLRPTSKQRRAARGGAVFSMRGARRAAALSSRCAARGGGGAVFSMREAHHGVGRY